MSESAQLNDQPKQSHVIYMLNEKSHIYNLTYGQRIKYLSISLKNLANQSFVIFFFSLDMNKNNYE